jgi:hypothetical protein
MKNSKLNYIVEPSSSLYSVIETPTDQVIKVYKVYKDAKDLMRHLNLGGAFDGWTPTFMLKKINIISEKSVY